MAGEWLKFDSTLPEKQETLAITAAMGWDDPDITVGKLMRLFRWFDQQTVDGNAANVTPALLDRVIGVSGFVSAVASVGWIVVNDRGLSLSNFERHNGATAKGRALTAKRVANHKANAGGNAKGNAETVSDTLPREEESREEKNSSSLRSEECVRTTPGEVCKAMKSAGMQGVNPSHPKLIALIDAGMTQAEFLDAAKHAVKNQKPFAYALATAEGRRRDAVTAPLPAGGMNAQEALEAANRDVVAKFLAKDLDHATH